MVVAWIILHSFSCDKHFYPGWPIFPVSLCTCCGCQENSLNPWSTAENSRGDVDLTVLVFYSENKAEHFMWIVCLADDSHVTFHVNRLSSRRFTCYATLNLHRKIRRKRKWKCRLLNMLSASRVKVGIHFIWQGRQKRTCWNVSTLLGSRTGRLMTGPGLGLSIQITT